MVAPPPWHPIVWDDDSKARVEKYFRKLRLDNTEDNQVTPTQLIAWYDASKHPEVMLKRRTPRQAFQAFLKEFKVSHRSDVRPREFSQFTTMTTAKMSIEELKKHYGTLDNLVRMLWSPLEEDISQHLIAASQDGDAGALISASRDRVAGVSPYLNSPLLAPPVGNVGDVPGGVEEVDVGSSGSPIGARGMDGASASVSAAASTAAAIIRPSSPRITVATPRESDSSAAPPTDPANQSPLMCSSRGSSASTSPWTFPCACWSTTKTERSSWRSSKAPKRTVAAVWW